MRLVTPPLLELRKHYCQLVKNQSYGEEVPEQVSGPREKISTWEEKSGYLRSLKFMEDFSCRLEYFDSRSSLCPGN